MSYPLRTLIRCVHDNKKMGTAVVVRGDPVYDENMNVLGYKNRFLQVRLGDVKGKECHAYFDTLDDWYKSMGIVYKQEPQEIPDDYSMYIVLFLSIMLPTIYAYYLQASYDL